MAKSIVAPCRYYQGTGLLTDAYRYVSHIGRNFIHSGIIEQYTFPLHLFSAIAYVVLFSRIKFPKLMQKIVSLAAPGAFAVYLIDYSCLFNKRYTMSICNKSKA